MALNALLYDYPYRVEMSDMAMEIVLRINEGCQNNTGKHGVHWVAFIDTNSLAPNYLFKQQEHAVKFTLTWS